MSSRGKQMLDPEKLKATFSHFMKGEYDTAVFAAFREVEVAVRRAGGFPDSTLGTNLMRQAFREQVGPLTDSSDVISEQQAIEHLFQGPSARLEIRLAIAAV